MKNKIEIAVNCGVAITYDLEHNEDLTLEVSGKNLVKATIVKEDTQSRYVYDVRSSMLSKKGLIRLINDAFSLSNIHKNRVSIEDTTSSDSDITTYRLIMDDATESETKDFDFTLASSLVMYNSLEDNNNK